MGETYWKSCHVSPSDLHDEVIHHAPPSNPYQVWPPPTKDSMGNKELPCNHIREEVQEFLRLKMSWRAFLSLYTSLIMGMASPHILITVLMTTQNLRIHHLSLLARKNTSLGLMTVIPLMKCHQVMMTLPPTFMNVTYFMVIPHHPLIHFKMS